MTIVDALDTMWIMGLKDEFYGTIPTIANLTFSLEEVGAVLTLVFFDDLIRVSASLRSVF